MAAFAVTAVVSLMRTPYGENFGFSDHYTHMNAARLFPKIGLELWRVPIDQMFQPDAGSGAVVPSDVRSAGGVLHVPGWPDDKPFAGGWTHLARPYPPGDLIVVGPIALIYHFTSLSFDAACHALIVLFLGFAHAAFYVIWQSMPARGRAIYLVAALTAYAYVAFWTLRGFYDSAAVLPLVWCASLLDKRRWLGALAVFSLAFFIHFRALFFVPWALYAAWRVIREGSWRSWSRLAWLVLGSAAVLSMASLYTFFLVRPALAALPLENPIHMGHWKTVPMVAFLCAIVCAVSLFIRTHSYLDIAMLVWIVLVLVSIRQVQAWHTFLLLPWIFATARTTGARFARIEFVVVVTCAVFL